MCSRVREDSDEEVEKEHVDKEEITEHEELEEVVMCRGDTVMLQKLSYICILTPVILRAVSCTKFTCLM